MRRLAGFFVLPPIIKSQTERLFVSQGPGSARPERGPRFVMSLQ